MTDYLPLSTIGSYGKSTYVMAMSQQTQNICITFRQRWPNIFDVEPTLYKFYMFYVVHCHR